MMFSFKYDFAAVVAFCNFEKLARNRHWGHDELLTREMTPILILNVVFLRRLHQLVNQIIILVIIANLVGLFHILSNLLSGSNLLHLRLRHLDFLHTNVHINDGNFIVD